MTFERSFLSLLIFFFTIQFFNNRTQTVAVGRFRMLADIYGQTRAGHYKVAWFYLRTLNPSRYDKYRYSIANVLDQFSMFA